MSRSKSQNTFPGFVPGLTPNDIDPSFPSELLPGVHALLDHSGNENGNDRESQPFGILTPNPSPPDGHDGFAGERFFTIQRVNGNGANGKNDGVGGGHRHTLEESDRVKKNSVQRRVLSQARERKRSSPVRISFFFLGVSYLAPEVDFNTALVVLYGFPVKHSMLQAHANTIHSIILISKFMYTSGVERFDVTAWLFSLSPLPSDLTFTLCS